MLGAGWDIRTRTIPNWLNLLVLLGATAMIALDWGRIAPLSHFFHFALALAGALILFRFRFWGGGDAKFYAACALWFGLDRALLFLVTTAAAGGVVVIASSIAKIFRGKRAWPNEVAYGVAIAVGAILTELLIIEHTA